MVSSPSLEIICVLINPVSPAKIAFAKYEIMIIDKSPGEQDNSLINFPGCFIF